MDNSQFFLSEKLTQSSDELIKGDTYPKTTINYIKSIKINLKFYETTAFCQNKGMVQVLIKENLD